MATNTAVYSGHSGVAKFDVGGSATLVASITAFGISNTGDAYETTVMGSSARTYLPGLTSATGSISLLWRDDDAAQLALYSGPGSAAATLELYPSGQGTGIKLSGEVIVTSHSIETGLDGAVTSECAVQFTGAITKADL